MVSQKYGAGKLNRIKSGMRAAIIMSVGTSVVIAAMMILLGRNITMLFISSDVPELVKAAGDTAYLYLCVMSICLPVLYLLYVYQSALRGLGNTVIPMISGFIEFALRVSISLWIGKIGFANGIFGAEVSAWFGAMFFMMIHYYRGFHKEEKLRHS